MYVRDSKRASSREFRWRSTFLIPLRDSTIPSVELGVFSTGSERNRSAGGDGVGRSEGAHRGAGGRCVSWSEIGPERHPRRDWGTTFELVVSHFVP